MTLDASTSRFGAWSGIKRAITYFLQEFCYVLSDVYNHDNTEQGYKEAFRVFSKDEEGAIPAEEIKWVFVDGESNQVRIGLNGKVHFTFRFVLMHLPGIKVKVLQSFPIFWKIWLFSTHIFLSILFSCLFAGNWRDDHHGGQESGWQDQLLGVQGGRTTIFMIPQLKAV